MISFILLIIFLTSFIIYGLSLNSHRYWRIRGVEQSHPKPFFGDSWRRLFQISDPSEFVLYYYNSIKNVRYYGIYQFFKPKLLICDPELIQRVTVKDFDHFVDHVSITDPKADPLISKNLLSLRGDEWRKMRSRLTNSFTSTKMKSIFILLSEAAQNFVKNFDEQNAKIITVESKDVFTRFTVDVIASASFGVKVDSLREPNNEFYKMVKEITEFKFIALMKVLLFQICPKLYNYLKLTLFRKEVNLFFSNIVEKTIKLREINQCYRPDMLQILMDARKKEDATRKDWNINNNGEKLNETENKITIEDITAQALIFLFAGFDSVSSALTFTAYELAMNQKVQQKLRDEILETNKKCNGEPTYEAITNMRYLDMIISESLRLRPPFVILGRECTKPYLINPINLNEKALEIPKGMGIQIPAYAIHHDAKYFPEPEKFLPERFDSELKSSIKPSTFLPFGQGPRACIGSRFALLEIKTLLFYLVGKFRLVAIEETQIPLKLSKKMTINIRPENGLWLGFEKL